MTNRRTVLRCSAAVALGATALSAFISGADLFSWVRWERFTVVDEPNLQYLQKVKAGIDPVHYLGPLGAPGLTGYAGITQVAKPKGVIAAQRVECGVPHVVSCRALGVSQAWLYKWRRGDPSLRRKRRAALAAVIAYLFKAHHGGYGSPRITADLREMGWVVSKNTVAGLMAEQGLLARRKRRRRSSTRSDRRARKAPDALRRDFTPPQRPNARWCGDLTEVPTDEGKLHLSAILDLHSRRCVGFAMGAHHDAELARAALCTAIAIRGGSVKGVLFHSDQGGEYTGEVFARACRNAGVTQSMGRTGSALDNAVSESFNSTLEFELLHQRRFATRDQARRAVAAWIDEYNTERRHSTNQMLSPVDYERAHAHNHTAGAPRQPKRKAAA